MPQENIDIQITERGSAQAAQGVQKVGTAAEVSGQQVQSFNSVLGQMNTVLGALGLTFTIGRLIALSDTYQEIINKLKLTSNSSQELVATEERLFGIAQQTRASFEGTVGTYSSLRKATTDLNISQDDLFKLVTTVNQAMGVSQKSADEVGGAMKRFALALQQGTLDGRGLTTVLLQFPALAKAIAGGMNVSVGQLKALGEQGQLTTKQVVEALQKSAPQVAAAFEQIKPTVSSAFTVLGNAVLRYVGQADQARGASELLSRTIILIANNMSAIGGVVTSMAVFFATFGTAILTTTGYLSGFFAVLARNPWALTIAAIAATIQLLYAFGSQISLTADGSVTALGVVSAAVSALTAVIATIWSSIIQPFFQGLKEGDPIFVGLAVSLGVLTTAFVAWRAVVVGNWLGVLITSLGSVAVGLGALAVEAAAVVLPFAAFLAVVVSLTALLAKLSDALGITKGAYENLTRVVDLGASVIKDKVGGALEIVNTKFKEGSAAAKKWSEDFTKSTKDATNATGDLATKTKKDMESTSVAIQTYMKNQEALRKNDQELQQFYSKTIQQENERIKQSTGEVATATEQMVNTQVGALAQSESAYTQWATAAEIALDRVIESENAAASAARQRGDLSKIYGDSLGLSNNSQPGQFGVIPTNVNTNYGAIQGLLDKLGVKTVSASDVGTAQFHVTAHDNMAKGLVENLRRKVPANMWKDFSDTFGFQGFKYGGDFVVGGQGGNDSQLVQFLATPGERVTVSPQQGRSDQNTNASSGGNGKASKDVKIYVDFKVMATDVGSFKRSEQQIYTNLLGKINRAAQSL